MSKSRKRTLIFPELFMVASYFIGWGALLFCSYRHNSHVCAVASAYLIVIYVLDLAIYNSAGYGMDDVAHDRAWLMYIVLDTFALVTLKVAKANSWAMFLLFLAIAYQIWRVQLEPYSSPELWATETYQILYLVWLTLFVGTLCWQAHQESPIPSV